MDTHKKLALASAGAIGAGLAYKKYKDRNLQKYGITKKRSFNDKYLQGHPREYIDTTLSHTPDYLRYNLNSR